ncbi:MAG: right-handed parallel beta-helix repeat-containing protein [Chloroflexi bacterium]|nr:right-handed parallel beta-helix repeat-containing protein [Chloroflexota bacterium]
MKRLIILAIALFAVAILVPTSTALAATDCTFTISGTTMTLDADCTTDQTIVVPDGYTLDGAGHTIAAVDPAGDHFTGAVIANGGTTAHVTNVTVTAAGLANVCDSGANRLRGIMFDGASGSITHNTVVDINQGASGCQEGNAVEVRNAPFDGAHPATKTVVITHNVIDDYQKSGIVANGDVNVTITHNRLGASATQNNLAANSIQFGFGALGSALHNIVEGNQWLQPTDWVGTAFLIYLVDGVEISKNNVRGNSDVGIYLYGADLTADNNKVFDVGADGPNGDWGIYLSGSGSVTNNKVRGFDYPYTGVTGGKNKQIPGPQGGPAWVSP